MFLSDYDRIFTSACEVHSKGEYSYMQLKDMERLLGARVYREDQENWSAHPVDAK